VTNPIRADGDRHDHELLMEIPICIFVADLSEVSATIREVNRRAELVYGYTAEELVGMPAANLVPEDARAVVLAILERVRQGQAVTAKTVTQRRDRTRFPVRIFAAPDPSHSDRAVVAVEDITAEHLGRTETEAIEAERHRIAHEIHDSVAQSLAGLRFKLVLWALRYRCSAT